MSAAAPRENQRDRALADRLDRARIALLFAELRRLAARERQVRQELAELLEQSRSPAAAAKLGRFLTRLAEGDR
jgi:hypothetical protein